MEFNIVGLECHDFDNKRDFYTRYPIDIVDRVLLFLSQDLKYQDIEAKFHSNKLSLEEKKIMCELLDYFTEKRCPDLKTSDIKRSYPNYILEKLLMEHPSLSQKMKKGKELTSKEKESVCSVLDELFNCSNYNKNIFKKSYGGKRLDNALKSLKKDPDFFKKFHSDKLSKSQKSALCYMLEYKLKPSDYKPSTRTFVRNRQTLRVKRSKSSNRKSSVKRKKSASYNRK